MNFKDESSDYQRGYRDGMQYMKDMEDESAIMEVIFGEKKLDDLSQVQLARFGEEKVAMLKAQGK